MPVQGLPFILDKMMHRGFFEVQYKNPQCNDFQLELKERDTDDEAWSASIVESKRACAQPPISAACF